jgi:hypothetical protein
MQYPKTVKTCQALERAKGIEPSYAAWEGTFRPFSPTDNPS